MNTALQQTDVSTAITLAFPVTEECEINAGLILVDGKPSHWVILLPGDKPDSNWQEAVDWAEEQGGELPTRNEQSLLFANTKDKFQKDWYWSGETHADEPEWAWYQGFSYGYQSNARKSYGYCRARAVRRISII